MITVILGKILPIKIKCLQDTKTSKRNCDSLEGKCTKKSKLKDNEAFAEIFYILIIRGRESKTDFKNSSHILFE